MSAFDEVTYDEPEKKKSPFDEVEYDKVEKVRPSNPIKQGFAGVTDIATGIPMLAGAVGSAVGTTFDRDDDPETHWGQEFMTNLMNNAVFKFGERGRRAVNETLGIEEPLSLEDQGARLLTSLFVPGVGPLGAIASSGSKAAMAVRALTPLVRMQKGKPVQNVARIGTQFAVGGGIDQGIRGLMEKYSPESNVLTPPIWAERARSGVDQPVYDEALTHLKTREVMSDAVYDDDAPLTVFDEATYGDGDVSIEDAANARAMYSPEWAERDRKVDRQENENTTNAVLATTLAAAALIFGVSRSQTVKQMTSKLTEGMNIAEKPNVIQEAINTIKQAEGVKGTYTAVKGVAAKPFASFNEKWIDSNAHIRRVLKENDFTDEQINQLEGQGSVDTYGTLHQILHDGKFTSSDIKTESMVELTNTVRNLPPERQAIFIDGIHAITEDHLRSLATKRHGWVQGKITTFDGEATPVRRTAPGLWRGKTLVTDDEVRMTINALKNDDELYGIAKKLAKVNEDTLALSVKRNVLDEATAQSFRDKFTIPELGVFYIPRRKITGRSGAWGRMAEMMGFHTSKAKELEFVANWKGMDLADKSMATKPLDPLHATVDYMYHVLDHTNRSNYQWNVLSRLGGIDIIDDAGRVALDANRIAGKSGPDGVMFMGRLDPNEAQPGQFKWRDLGGGKGVDDTYEAAVRKKLGIDQKTDVANFMDKGDKIIVQRKGQFYMFQLDDPHLKRALEMDSRLSGQVLQFMNQWKKNFTLFTTGKFSPFAPVSFLYNQQLAGISAFTHAADKGGFVKGVSEYALANWDSVRGATEIFATGLAKQVNQILIRNLDQHVGLTGKVAPELTRRLSQRLEKKIANSILAPVQREVGSTASSLAASQFSGNITDALEQAAPVIHKMYGANALPMIGRVWTNLNSALHEGTALGRVMREADRFKSAGGDVTKMTDQAVGNLYRKWAAGAKNLVGDVRRRGTSPVAEVFHASVPFSGAMFQAWAVVGNALRKNPGKFGLALATTIGLPTAMEVTWNNSMDPEATFDMVDENGTTKSWTYQDYYWNGFTTQQRNDNTIMFIPGKPPWEAVLVPQTPEFTLMRSIVIESMDAIFGLSNVGISGMTGINGNHWSAALTRVFDIPVPPPVGLLASLTGQDLRVGFHESIGPDGKETFQFLHTTPQGIARIGGDRTAKEVGDNIDMRTQQILNDIFGAGAATYIGMAEAYFGGADDEAKPFTERVSRALSEGGMQLKRQARFTQPIYGKALSPNPNKEITKAVMVKRNSLLDAAKDKTAYETSGVMASEDLVNIGDALTGVDDPVWAYVATFSGDAISLIKPLDTQIARLRKKINLAENSNTISDEAGQNRRAVSVSEKRDFIDAWKLQMSAYKSQQLVVLKQFEDSASAQLGQILGQPDFKLDLSTLRRRANFTKQPTSSPN